MAGNLLTVLFSIRTNGSSQTSIVPHTLYRDAVSLIKTFEILPEYLKTRTRGKVNDYRDWGVPLGRRFRALKLWSVIRSYGVEELRNKLRYHIQIAARLSEMISGESDFEILAPVTICVVCFRYRPAGYDEKQINAFK